MTRNLFIRLVKVSDSAELLEIYTPYVLHTSFTPESKVPSLPDFQNQIEQVITDYPFLVCQYNNQIAGYAYAHPYRQASGHQWSVETTIYCAPLFQGKGIAGALYKVLLDILRLQNFINVFAGIILPNGKSVAFHQKFNFTRVGIFEKGIYKADAWHDVLWMQLALKEPVENPAFPLPLGEVVRTEAFKKIMENVNYPVN